MLNSHFVSCNSHGVAYIITLDRRKIMNQEKIGKFIAELRKNKKMTQQDLAEKLGTTDKSISRWENGKCMPDLSLFPLLSKELEVSVNDLMNGEIVDKKEYQETFEKNVVNTISKVDKNNHNWNILTNILIGIMVLVCLWFVSYIFYINYGFFQKYDSEKMVIENVDDGNLFFATNRIANIKYLLTTYKENDEEIGLIFVYLEQTLQQKGNEKIDFSGTNGINIINGLSSKQKIFIIGTNLPSNYKVYYTDVGFKKISNSSNEELKEIIKKSNLMYENQQN